MTFVWVGNGEDGIGKLVSRTGGRATVAYFISPVGPQIKELQVDSVQVTRRDLPNQTLIYWHDPDSLSWRQGRTDGEPISPEALNTDEEHYAIRFPNSEKRRIPASELYVLWARGVDDPSDLVAARVTESAYFVDGRRRLGRFLSAQRSACRGIVGLSASAIEYYPHQVATVRRVLMDPIQRYILADEVGLGKTIEAGVLIRQHLAERGEGARVEIVVPRHLQPQWRDELKRKFFVEPGGTVAVRSPDEVGASGENPTMLVVDEAHRAARWAFSEQIEDRRRFAALATRAQRADRVLLLSATPVRNEEDGFLAMLHLIDPDGYPLTEREAFRLRVRERQTVADCLADLDDDAGAFFVREAIDALEAAFGDDDEMASRCKEVRAHIEEDSGSSLRASAIGALRVYVSETYRLHRRLLRTRRDDRSVVDALPQRRGLEEILCNDDTARATSAEFLEDWRRSLPPGDPPQGTLELFAEWAEAAFSHPLVLARCIDVRVEQLQNCGRPAFSEELTFLRTWRQSFEQDLEREPRAEAIARWVEANGRAIVFVDNRQVAARVVGTLERWLGKEQVARQLADAPEGLRRFRQRDAKILVVDGDHEEGVNLQEERAAVILYDMPMAPQRLEQRIGRVDRIEGPQRVRLLGFEPVGIYETAWRSLLADVAKVFNRSISPLQYTLSDATARIKHSMIEAGSAAIDGVAEDLLDNRTGLESELRRIRAQEAMDSLEWNLEEEQNFVEELQQAEDEAEETGRSAFDAWMTSLQFESRGDCAFHYVHHIRGQRPTLLPLEDAHRRFAPFIDRKAASRGRELPFGPFTLDKDEAVESGEGLLRVGHPFVSAVEALLRDDPRGVAWAYWRPDPDWQPDGLGIYMGFDFTVDAETEELFDIVGALSRSSSTPQMVADAAFPPLRQTVWVDLDGTLVDDPTLISILSREYTPAEKGGSDVNLRFDRWLKVDEIRPLDDWTARCERARHVAEKALRSASEVVTLQVRATNRLRKRLDWMRTVLSSRIAHLEGAAHRAELQLREQELAIGKSLGYAIQHPRVRVDSCGIVVLAPTAF